MIGTAERLGDLVEGAWGRRLIRSWDEAWMDEPVVLGDRIGEVVLGAAAGRTVVGDSTSVLLYKLIRAATDLDDGRDEIVVDRANFPTDRFLLQGIAAERHLTLRWLDVGPFGEVEPEALGAVLSERTALVVLSHVAYRSGFLADAETLTGLTHSTAAPVHPRSATSGRICRSASSSRSGGGWAPPNRSRWDRTTVPLQASADFSPGLRRSPRCSRCA